MQNLRRVGKNAGRVLSRLWTKVHDILGRCRRPLVVLNALDRLSIPCFVELRSQPIKELLGPRFVGRSDTPDFGHAFQITLTSEFRPCGQIWFSSVQRAMLWGYRDASDLISMVSWFHVHSLCGATLFGLHQRYLPLPVWQSMIGFRFSCAMPGNETKGRIYGGCAKTPVLI